MKNYIPTRTIKLCETDKVSRMRQRYRLALMAVGKSPDYHIFNLSMDFLRNLKDSKAKRFLLSLKKYVATLDEDTRVIFITDILEGGRHYAFWYMDSYSNRVYEEKLRCIVEGVPPCLAR